MGRGDYPTVELERTTHREIVHQLRFGAAAMLFSNHNPKKTTWKASSPGKAATAAKLTLRTDELPDWADDGKLGITTFCSTTTTTMKCKTPSKRSGRAG